MKIMRVDVKVGSPVKEATDVLILLLCERDGVLEQDAAAVDKALGGALSDLFKSNEFDGKTGELALLHTQRKIPAKRVLLAGLGKQSSLGLDTIRQAMGYAIKRVKHVKAASCTVAIPAVAPADSTLIDVAQAIAEGAILGSYQFTAYRTSGTVGHDVKAMTLLASRQSDTRPLSEGVRRGVATGEATVFVRDLCNHPSNIMTPTRVAQEAKAIAKETGVSLKILERKDMEKMGMGALLGVARGSHEPPKFIILEYRGSRKKDDRPVVLVGKTITFDTGGISLKPAENMEHMKA
ncbi:MAG: leucyl aminopeptidase, partial [Nitrospira sp.]|nr:leucyl aminopeptidase [Nitrospira sp.]